MYLWVRANGPSLNAIKKKRKGSSVLKFLFGIPSADDADYDEKFIYQTIHDKKNLQLIMKNQVQIMRNTILNLNSTISDLISSENVLNRNVGLINTFMKQTIDEMQKKKQ